MKSHMSQHIETTRSQIFAESCQKVKTLLREMCRTVENEMSMEADVVFLAMQRDYMEVVAGRQMPEGGMMPKWERSMRADVAKIIKDRSETAEQE